ncbi:MAG: dephospho-CoA kinase [Sphingobacteriaceae bacterium]|nr:dephospho-CoA kinase [Sphingobacteriaceae bacterium]
MLKIGITGGIGSGKTTVCKVFELQKIPVFYADSQAKALMHTDQLLMEQIKNHFGSDVYSEQGVLNRKYLAAIVFSDEDMLKKLNSFVHPAVFRAFDSWVLQQSSPYVIKEAALLFESGSFKKCDFTVLVTSPENLKVSRIIKRDSITADDVLKRMNKQLSDEEKEELADFVLCNDEKQLLIPQVLNLHNEFLNRSSSL